MALLARIGGNTRDPLPFIMRHSPDNEYHDPQGAGSLVSALRAWQALRSTGHDHLPHSLSFGLLCTGEARARRVAHFLRRRLSCDFTSVDRTADAGRGGWQVAGTTTRSVQSLSSLEHFSAWLRKAAASYQVRLNRMTLVGDAA
ncbi:MAG TPA: hypothetical protein VLE53_03470 [Gemmatimonadaceae bacterium]|nr:hypothetical protein [Gemmatimonadaceae bacterium]